MIWTSWFQPTGTAHYFTLSCLFASWPALAANQSDRSVQSAGPEMRGRTVMLPMQMGTWCSGITSASHAEGPGFKSQCVHFSKLLKAVPLRCHPCEAHAPKLGNITRSPLRTSLRHKRNRRIGILKGRHMGTWRNDAKPLNMRPALGSSSNQNDTEGTRTLADRACL